MLSFMDFILDRLPPELAAKCLPAEYRMLMYHTCKRLHASLPGLRLGVALRVTSRPKNLPTLLANTSRKFCLEGLDMSAVTFTVAIVREFSYRKAIDWSHLKSLTIGDVYLNEHDGIFIPHWLQRCSALTTTDAFGRIPLSGEAWAVARRCQHINLSLLNKNLASFENVGVELSKCTQLKTLGFSFNFQMIQESPGSVQMALRALSGLTALNVSCNYTVQDNLPVLMEAWHASLGTLQVLNLSNMVIQEKTFRLLGENLSLCDNLRDLNLSKTCMCDRDIEAFLHGLRGGAGPRPVLTKLTHLRISENPLLSQISSTASVTDLVSSLPSLTHVEMRESITPGLFVAMGNCSWISRLQHFEAAWSFFWREDAQCFGRLEGKMDALTRVRIYNCDLEEFEKRGIDSIPDLARVFKRCSRLCMLDLAGVHVDAARAGILADGLSGATFLRVLKLTYMNLDEDSVVHIFRLLNECRALEVLNLQRNSLHAAALSAAVETLHRPCMLRVLDLSCNEFGPQGVACLGRVHHLFPKLLRLDLSCCRLDVSGAMLAAKLLPHWPCLQRVNVAANDMGDAGGRALGEAQRVARWVLDLSANGISKRVQKLLREQGCSV